MGVCMPDDENIGIQKARIEVHLSLRKVMMSCKECYLVNGIDPTSIEQYSLCERGLPRIYVSWDADIPGFAELLVFLHYLLRYCTEPSASNNASKVFLSLWLLAVRTTTADGVHLWHWNRDRRMHYSQEGRNLTETLVLEVDWALLWAHSFESALICWSLRISKDTLWQVSILLKLSIWGPCFAVQSK